MTRTTYKSVALEFRMKIQCLPDNMTICGKKTSVRAVGVLFTRQSTFGKFPGNNHVRERGRGAVMFVQRSPWRALNALLIEWSSGYSANWMYGLELP